MLLAKTKKRKLKLRSALKIALSRCAFFSSLPKSWVMRTRS